MMISSFVNQTAECIGAAKRRLHTASIAAVLCLAPSLSVAQTTTVPAPMLRIHADGSSGRPTIGTVSHALQLTNGTLVIADNTDRRLHYFSSTGAHRQSVGRDGGGPGEFTSLTWIGECARDSVFVFDRMQNRITVYSADGQYVRQRVIALDPELVSCASNGTLTLANISGAPTPGTASRGSILTVDARDVEMVRARDVLVGGERPLAAMLKMTAAPGVLVYGAGDSARVFVVENYETPRTIRAGVALRTPTDAQRNAAIEQVVMRMPGTKADMEITRTYARRLGAAKVLPAYSALMLDDVTRLLWVQQSVPGDGETVLERRTLTGALQATVRIQEELDVFSVRNNVLVARSTNRDGEQSLVLFRLTDSVR